MRYYVNPGTGIVHTADCPRVRDWPEWNPAKAHLTPGVNAHSGCLPGGLPKVEQG